MYDQLVTKVNGIEGKMSSATGITKVPISDLR